MNKRIIISIIGKIVLTEVILMIPALLVSLAYQDGDAAGFIYTMVPEIGRAHV